MHGNTIYMDKLAISIMPSKEDSVQETQFIINEKKKTFSIMRKVLTFYCKI